MVRGIAHKFYRMLLDKTQVLSYTILVVHNITRTHPTLFPRGWVPPKKTWSPPPGLLLFWPLLHRMDRPCGRLRLSQGLGPHLKTVAELIDADVGIRIFFSELGGGGFDNHANQRDNRSTSSLPEQGMRSPKADS